MGNRDIGLILCGLVALGLIEVGMEEVPVVAIMEIEDGGTAARDCGWICWRPYAAPGWGTGFLEEAAFWACLRMASGCLFLGRGGRNCGDFLPLRRLAAASFAVRLFGLSALILTVY